MRQMVLAAGPDLDGFRRAVRALVAARVAPEEVTWSTEGAAMLFQATQTDDSPAVPLPPAAHDLIRLVVCHRDPERYGLLYRLVWRLLHG